MIADLDLVSRDEYEVLKAMFEKSQAEIEALRKEVKKLKKAQNKQV